MSNAYCGMCAYPMRGERLGANPNAKQARQEADQRLEYLHKEYGPPSQDSAARLMAELMRYVAADGDANPLPQAVTDMDIVRFFIGKDKLGRTIVHVDGCNWWGVKRDTGCACPVRLAVATVKSQSATLRGAFRDLGLISRWDAVTMTGNPCASAQVDRYIAAIEREHCEAGVETVRAALVDVTVYNRVMQAALTAWSEAPAGSLGRVKAARDAFLYALLWSSGLRCGDALRMQFGAIRLFDDGPSGRSGGGMDAGRGAGMTVDVTRAKSIKRQKDAHRITLWDDGDPLGPSRCLQLYMHELKEFGFADCDLRGSVFKRVLVADDGGPAFGSVSPWSELAGAYYKHLARIGLDTPELRRHITLHSWHGSRAAREKRMGIPPEDTCKAMCWSMEMYLYYTEGREPLTIEGVLIMEEIPAAVRAEARVPLGA